MPRLLEAGLGPGGRRTVVWLGLLAALRAAGLVLVAEGLATGVVAIQAGGSVRDGLTLAAAGVVLRTAAAWAVPVVAARGAGLAREAARRRLVGAMLEPGAPSVGSGEAAQLAANGLDALDEYYAAVVPAAVSAVVVPIGLGAWILWSDWLSALILVLTVPLVPLFMALIGLHTRERVAAAQATIARLADRMLELARGLPVIVGLGRDREEGAELRRLQDASRAQTLGTLRTAFLSSLALELVATLSVAVLAVVLGIRLLDDAVLLAPAIVVLVLAPDVFGALRDVGTAFHGAQDGLAAMRRVEELAAPLPAPAARAAVATADGVAVAGLTVRRPGRSAAILDDVSAWFPRGRMTVVTGPSGAGKSTLLDELAGSSGEGVAYAPQAPVFATHRVGDELELYGVADPTALLAEFGAAALVDADPAQLSPGEQRLVAVAAAVAVAEAGAGVVLLDEPTAHLDAVAAERVRRRIARLAAGRVLVVVTHDPELVAIADRRVEVPLPPVAPRSAPRVAAPAPSRRSAAPVAAPASRARWIGAWILGGALGVLAVGSGLALAGVSGWLIVRASEVTGVTLLLVAIVGVRFFGLARAVARYAERLVVHRAVLVQIDELRLRLWAGLAARGAASRRLLSGGSTADLLIGRLAQLREALPRAVVPGVVGVVGAVGAAVVAAVLVPSAGVWVVGLVLLGVLLGLLVQVPVRRQLASRGALRAGLARRIASVADAGAVLAANGAAPRAEAGLAEVAAALRRIDGRIAALSGIGAAVVTAGVLGAGVATLTATGAGAPAVAAAAMLLVAALEPALGLLPAVRHAGAARAAWRELAPALAVPPAPPSGALAPPAGALAIAGLGARWPEADAPAFVDVDARVDRGDWLVVTGPSGSGKSTLLTVLLGRLAPAAGSVAIGDVDLAAADPDAWRGRVAWCPQEAHVFDSTIRGNLLLASRSGVDDAALEAVLRRVGLGPLLDGLDDGLSTRVGAAGRGLSGGERQRLAVARALLADRSVLLLDEPTAHLDPPGARGLLEDLRRASADRVVVLVTHRPDEIPESEARVDLGRPALSAAR